ncbi:MAG: hypothetical protein JWN21_1585 [Sphingomonas bacterium]|uniref:AraC family transcriptional regulator n=1 Tax=Sphingomonas bacterium TaxID=1895847 RepID=UPI0026194BA0|nr:helix-turn-helix domain-containing protein [Sphingomonas bacterium]MDB5696042.1 hypothetical protein [Sphingomonas bacterium]
MQQSASRVEVAPPSIRILMPDERLQPFATFYYFVTVAGELEDFLYPEWGNVRFTLGGRWWVEERRVRAPMPLAAALFGPTDRAMKVVAQDGVTAGFGLTPLGWQRLFDQPAHALANQRVDLGDRLGPSDNELLASLTGCSDEQSAALFDRLLFDRLTERPPNSAEAIAVDRALRMLPCDVGAFAAAAGTDPRQLGRVCKAVFGFGPKRLLRRQRFLDTLGRMRVTEDFRFADVRGDDYHDQSHFNHEFHEFMGLSPRKYLSVPRPLMGQAALVQLQMGIPLTFVLPPPPDEDGVDPSARPA